MRSLLMPSLAACAAIFAQSCASSEYIRLYATQDKAPSLDWEAIGALDHLGPTVIDNGVNFSLFSANAERIELLLFDDPESDRPTQQFELTPYGDVWNLFVEGVGPGQHYGYIAWGSNWPYVDTFYPGSLEGYRADVDERGNRFNPNKLLIDPYAKSVHRDHDWSRGSAASGPMAAEVTYAAAAKSVVVASSYTWNDADWMAKRASGDHPGHDWNDLILYEVHPKGLTANQGSVRLGVESPGTYRGIGEIAGYLQDLGITAVELLPVHEKPLDAGYWGYNNISYFALEVSYSEAWLRGRDPVETVDEFKWMVDQLHKHDIEVIVDVVYNHTGEGGLWRNKLFFNDTDGDFICNPADFVALDSAELTTMLSWRGLDSPSYYVLSNAGQGFWTGSTGVGNQTRANHRPMRRMILDSLRYMVEELHVDGFRFDLAGVLGEADGAPSQYWQNPTDTVLNDIADDPVLVAYGTRLIAEPWTTAYDGSTQFPISTVDDEAGWYEWNANFRDWWRSFINEDGFRLNSRQGLDGGAVMTGSFDRYAWNGRRPYHSVNFVTAHDGFTMFDLFSYWNKQNACGPLNPICCDDACSVWCDPNSGDNTNHSRVWGDEWTKRQMIRNAFVGLMISHGSVMILGGDEWMRTQYGNNNSYSTWADNDWNWHRWNEWLSENRNNVFRHRMHDFVRDLIKFRKAHTYAFSPSGWGEGMSFAWKNPSNQPADDLTWGGKSIMKHYFRDGGIQERELAVLINMEDFPVTFTLPGGRSWGVVVDTQAFFDLPGRSGEPDGYFSENAGADPFASQNIVVDEPRMVSGSYQVPARTMVIVKEQ